MPPHSRADEAKDSMVSQFTFTFTFIEAAGLSTVMHADGTMGLGLMDAESEEPSVKILQQVSFSFQFMTLPRCYTEEDWVEREDGKSDKHIRKSDGFVQ
jgi:hypothetical protein